ncbi:nose resistant to fluoxetine protein 6-like isoform X2 [Tachypleus tridentatus]|uniref:nose resistant to fluoxetine protein 6-like isoform X2 n=1 Tax=Tachypleus tridentatus TaxID=6853 RepID=UPI003FD581DF
MTDMVGFRAWIAFLRVSVLCYLTVSVHSVDANYDEEKEIFEGFLKDLTENQAKWKKLMNSIPEIHGAIFAVENIHNAAYRNLLESGTGDKIDVVQLSKLKRNSENLSPDVRNSSAVSNCQRDITFVFSSVGVKLGDWPSQMIDSFGKPQSGIFRGALVWPGKFRQCVNVKIPDQQIDNVTTISFKSQYNMVAMAIVLHDGRYLYVSMGICTPDSCTTEELKHILSTSNLIIGQVPGLKDVIKGIYPYDVKRKPLKATWETRDTVVVCIYSGVGVLLLAGTLFDVIKRKIYTKAGTTETKGGAVDLPTVTGNTSEEREEASVKVNETGRDVTVVNGGLVVDKRSTDNVIDMLEDADNFAFQAISKGSFGVDTYFLLSGLLLSYLFFKQSPRPRGVYGWIYFYVHRFWRLTPVYMIIIGYEASLWRHLGSGPFWPYENGVTGKNCRDSWWFNILYINNFKREKEMCLSWSWYLANDMQFYVISPLFLLPLLKWRRIGLGVIFFTILGSLTAIGVLSTKHEFYAVDQSVQGRGVFMGAPSEENEKETVFDVLYTKPWCRIGPYLVGILVGYALHLTGQKKSFINKWLVLMGWLVATGICMGVVYGLYKANPNLPVSSFYNTVSRTVWAIGVGWLVYACVTGHGGFINTLLSWRLWIPLSRLTYSAYLIHPMIQFWYYFSNETKIHASHTVMAGLFMTFLIWSYGLALVTSLAFESPMMGLEKLVVGRRGR